jgi:pSer/pThr/pTyr-binding forkhead associated (FHA) protein
VIGDDDRTKTSSLPAPTPDEQPTAAQSNVGVVAELRAVFGNGEKKTLPLYSLPDSIVVGRGTASDWQLDDPSLSRKHCQFKWNGSALTVEDLGSANGTRVGARPARTALPVTTDDVVQLGTVVISFVSLLARLDRNIDAEATQLVASPSLPAGGPAETTPMSPMLAGNTAPMPAAKTVVKAPAQHGPPNARAAVFHPERDAAGPDEKTRLWDANAALVRAPERNLDAGELVARFQAAWKTNRRPFVLAGAAVWIAILLGVVALRQQGSATDDEATPVPHAQQPVSPRKSGEPSQPSGETARPTDKTGDVARPEAGGNIVEPSLDREQDLADAVAAYDNGRPQEALRYFRRLATDPNDKVSRFMVQLIESRGAATP